MVDAFREGIPLENRIPPNWTCGLYPSGIINKVSGKPVGMFIVGLPIILLSLSAFLRS